MFLDISLLLVDHFQAILSHSSVQTTLSYSSSVGDSFWGSARFLAWLTWWRVRWTTHRGAGSARGEHTHGRAWTRSTGAIHVQRAVPGRPGMGTARPGTRSASPSPPRFSIVPGQAGPRAGWRSPGPVRLFLYGPCRAGGTTGLPCRVGPGPVNKKTL
jgi:hypothetical protein